MSREDILAYITETAGQLDGDLLRNLYTRAKTLRGMSNSIPDHDADTGRNHAESSGAVVTSRRRTATTE